MYLGGNGLNCEVSLPDDGATMIAHNGDNRVLQANLAKYESRFGMRVESEANLLGVVYTETGVMTAAPYRVERADHWIFSGTGVNNGDLFGQRSLHERIPGGASGHETDKISPSSPQGIVRLAKGLNPNDGGGEIAYYETPSGGAVFSVGSICWPSSLLVDDVVASVTANVLRRFTAIGKSATWQTRRHRLKLSPKLAGGKPTRTRYGVLGFLCSLSFVLYLDRVCIGQAAVPMQRDLGLSNTELGYAFGAFTIAYGLFEVPTGRWGDRFGSRGVLARIVLWWSFFTAMTGAATGLTMLVVVRFLFGAGEAGAIPTWRGSSPAGSRAASAARRRVWSSPPRRSAERWRRSRRPT